MKKQKGFGIIELLVVLALAAMVTMFAHALHVRMYRRYQMTSAVREVQSIILATRMLAIRTGNNAVVHFDTDHNRVTAWADGNRNFIQDANEPTRFQFQIPPISMFATPFNAGGDKHGVVFDAYVGRKTLTDLIAFRLDGSIVDPQCSKCNAPRTDEPAPDAPYGSIDCRGTNGPSNKLPPLHGTFNGNNGMGCRGIYMTKIVPASFLSEPRPSDDVFRISVDRSSTGRVTTLKWVGRDRRSGLLFVPPNPAWVWFD